MYFEEIKSEFCKKSSYFSNSFNSFLLKLDNEKIKVDNINLLNLFPSLNLYKSIQQSFGLSCSMFKFEIFSINGKIFSIKFSKQFSDIFSKIIKSSLKNS